MSDKRQCHIVGLWIGSAESPVKCCHVDAWLSWFRGKSLSKCFYSAWDSCKAMYGTIQYSCTVYVELWCSVAIDPLQIPTFLSYYCCVQPAMVLLRHTCSHSEEHIAEQRENWQHDDRQDTWDYFRYETKAQLSNFAIFYEIQTINTFCGSVMCCDSMWTDHYSLLLIKTWTWMNKWTSKGKLFQPQKGINTQFFKFKHTYFNLLTLPGLLVEQNGRFHH